MINVSSTSHETLVSLENLNSESEYVVSIRSISAPGSLSKTNVTIQLENTGVLGLNVTIIVFLTIGSLILVLMLVAVIYNLYR